MTPLEEGDELRELIVEAIRHSRDPIALTRFRPIVRLHSVQRCAATEFRDGWCADGRAARKILTSLVDPVAEVLPPDAAEMLRAMATGVTAAALAKRLGCRAAALLKRTKPQIEEAALLYLQDLESRCAGQ